MFSLRLYQRKLIKCEHDESLNSGTDGDTKQSVLFHCWDLEIDGMGNDVLLQVSL